MAKNLITGKQGPEDEFLIKQDAEDSLLQTLLREYELLSNRSDQLDNRILQVLGVALGILTFIGGFILKQPISNEIAWLTPILCIAIFTYLIIVTYFATANIWNGRILTLRINTLIGETALIRFDPDSPEGWFFSTRRGNIKFRALYLTLLGGCTAISIVIIYVSFTSIYGTSHLAGSLFILIYGFVLFLLFYCCIGFFTDLPDFYRAYLRQYQIHTSSPPQVMDRILGYSEVMPARGAISNIGEAFASIFPRPWNILTNGPFFIYGFVIAFLIVGFTTDPIAGLPYNHLQEFNFLFSISGSAEWKSISAVPLWAVCALGVIFFIVEEILLQQAKHIWDDIRDKERDKKLELNKRRPIASGRISIHAAILQMVVRWTLAVILGYVLGGIVLLLVFLLISFHQIVYVLWAKQRSARYQGSEKHRHQAPILFFLAFSVPLRFLAGVVAVVGSQWSLATFVLFFVLFYFTSFGALAAFWKMEAIYYQNEQPPIRPQSNYYLTHGEFWQHVGLVAAVIVGIVMIIIQSLTLSCSSEPPILQVWYSRCINGAINYIDLGPLNSTIWTITLIAAFLLVTIILVYTSGKIGSRLRKIGTLLIPEKTRRFLVEVIGKIKGLATTLLFLFTFCSFITLVFIQHDIFLLYLGFLLLNAGYLLMYEGMTYRDYTMENLKKRLPLIGKAFYVYLFRPDLKIGLKELIFIASTDIDFDKLPSINFNKLSDLDFDKLKLALSAKTTGK